MVAFGSYRKRRLLFLGILFVAFFIFTADILDLREELRIITCPCSFLDSNVTTGLISTASFQPEPILFSAAVKKETSVSLSFIYLLPYGFRAPPQRS